MGREGSRGTTGSLVGFAFFGFVALTSLWLWLWLSLSLEGEAGLLDLAFGGMIAQIDANRRREKGGRGWRQSGGKMI